ncbi:MAG: hypothetical protein V1875_00660 [Candidatus Altiarchaeota archaeon]
MSKLGSDLLTFMVKWSGKSGGLILVNELKKLGIVNIDSMSDEQKEKLMTGLTQDYLCVFLGHSRFLMARAELVGILGINPDSYRVNDRGYGHVPRSPNLMGKPTG